MQTLHQVMKGTTVLTCMVFVLLVGATAFGLVFRGMGGDRTITHMILQSNMGPHMFLFLVMLIRNNFV